MLENLLIVDATMIIGVLFVEAIGRAFGIRVVWSAGRWMLIWGLVALLPFSVSAVLALIGTDLAIAFAGVGFIGFIAWFILISAIMSPRSEVGECQEVVEEKDLEEWLKEGWRVVAVLRSGKVVVE